MMKKTILSAFLLLAGLSLAGCERYDEDNKVVDMFTKHFTVESRDWKWNADYRRWECFCDWGEIDTYMYEYGSVDDAVFVREDNIEVLREMPYSQWYYDRDNVPYQVAISSDITPREICFYIQSSWLDRLEINQDYTFKVTIFWRERIDNHY
jgi:hypothetical protein